MSGQIAQAVALGLLGLCFVAFASASYRHFRATESPGNTAIRLLTLLASAGFAVLCLMSPAPEAWVSLVATGLAMLSLGVFRAAMAAVPDRVLDVAFTGSGPDRLVRQGIYGRVRHPLYLAYLLYWGAWVFAAGGAWPTLGGLVLFATMYWAAARQEERYLAGRFGAEFIAHKRAAGLFWPLPFGNRQGRALTADGCPEHRA